MHKQHLRDSFTFVQPSFSSAEPQLPAMPKPSPELLPTLASEELPDKLASSSEKMLELTAPLASELLKSWPPLEPLCCEPAKFEKEV